YSAPGEYIATLTVTDDQGATGTATAQVFAVGPPSPNSGLERVSLSSLNEQGDSDSGLPSISADGRFVAFVSYADNLVGHWNNGVTQVYVRDRKAGTTEFVSVSSDGGLANGTCEEAVISADGRYVAFGSAATNLVVPPLRPTDGYFPY